MTAKHVLAILAVWFFAALVVVASGALERVPVPPPVFVAGLATLTIAIGFLAKPVRAWLYRVDLRALFVPHLVRFVGIAFLVLVGRGVLVREFVPIGWGDAIAACGALALLIVRPDLSTRAGWWGVLAWNAFGFLDMLLLVATGVRLGAADPEQFALFRRLPFGLLPTFFVPLIIATHVFLFARLRNRGLGAN